ncbi:MAG: DUF2125 domain-containing protein [Proteobacteria bacterium]|nr:DUF2125 domain-containing protein [Pseudomonadota bacterium]MBS0572137.1 DUF2125 domain-containing protein [Pseudomonadota bacterium]
MNRTTPLSASALLAAILCAGAAHADVTPEQVWQEWKDYYAGMGQTITAGSEARDGDTLVIKDVKWAQGDAATAKTEFTLGELRLKDAGDGSVELTLPAELPMAMTVTPADGKPVETKMKVAQTGFSARFSGTTDSMDSEYAMPDLTFSVDEVKAEGQDAPVKLQLAVKGGSGKGHVDKADGRTITQDMKADSVDFTVTGAAPDGSGTFNMSGSVSGLTGTGGGMIPAAASMADVNAAMQAGFAFKSDLAYAASTFKADATGKEGPVKVEGSGGAGKLAMSMSKDGIAYGGDSVDAKLSISGPMPFPVEASLAQQAFNFAMPVSKSDEAKPAALMVKLIDLKVSDELWNMVDPSAKLPHDPATLVLDLTGSIKPLIDLFDPKQSEELVKKAEGGGGTAPFEVSSAKLNQLQVKAVGAELTGTGDVTFDNSGPTPKPVGAVDLTLTGANKLMDNLSAMGLLPAEQVTGYKMMLGMFTVPAGDDAVKSKIEFKEDGGLYANGQRLQ